jgi:TonB family protein
MGTVFKLEYETRDYGAAESDQKVTETSAGSVEHNRKEWLDEGKLPTGREPGQPKAAEPASIMANDLLTYPETESRVEPAVQGGSALDVSFGMAVKEKPIWTDLYENLRDIFFPPHLPPLELTSKPIPVPDRMKVKANPWAIGIATTLNVTILIAAIFFGVAKVVEQVKKNDLVVTPVDVSEFKAPKKDVAAGGGGGSPDKMEASKGKIPPRAKPLDIAPKSIAPPVPTIDVQKDILIPSNQALPNFGMSNSPNVKLGSLGNGSGMGIGNGNGNGYGNGSGGNIGGGTYRVGGLVSGPVPLVEPEAEFSDEARRAKYQGVCIVQIVVDAQGNPQNPHVVRTLGMGLDENAVEAVMKYKFRPAMREGKPVSVWPVNIEVNFRLY